MSEKRFVYRPDHPHGPNVIDTYTGKWMSIESAKKFADVVYGALQSSPQSGDVGIIEECRQWFESHAKTISKGYSTNAFELMELREMRDKCDAALSTPSQSAAPVSDHIEQPLGMVDKAKAVPDVQNDPDLVAACAAYFEKTGSSAACVALIHLQRQLNALFAARAPQPVCADNGEAKS